MIYKDKLCIVEGRRDPADFRLNSWLKRINNFKKQTQNSYDLQIDVLILPTPNDSTKVHPDIYINMQKRSATKTRSCRSGLISELPKAFWNLNFNCFRSRLVSSFAANVSEDVFLQVWELNRIETRYPGSEETGNLFKDLQVLPNAEMPSYLLTKHNCYEKSTMNESRCTWHCIKDSIYIYVWALSIYMYTYLTFLTL